METWALPLAVRSPYCVAQRCCAVLHQRVAEPRVVAPSGCWVPVVIPLPRCGGGLCQASAWLASRCAARLLQGKLRVPASRSSAGRLFCTPAVARAGAAVSAVVQARAPASLAVAPATTLPSATAGGCTRTSRSQVGGDVHRRGGAWAVSRARSEAPREPVAIGLWSTDPRRCRGAFPWSHVVVTEEGARQTRKWGPTWVWGE